MKKRIIVLVSGNGSNLQAIINACQNNLINGKIVAVISNKPDVYSLMRAKQANIPSHVINHKEFATREAFDHQLQLQIEQYQPDLIVLAGYMRILTPHFVQHYSGKMLNIHPSLLPKYPGLNTHRRAMEAGDKEHGTTVHFVTDELDGGPIILQAKVPIFDNDEEQDIVERVLAQEHQIYPLVIKWFCDDRLTMINGRAYLDQTMIPKSGYAED
ncbi:phosphoribosylglycinamide formyltransferase [Frischella perrara]|uniref:Phosphoribosylglycinamide formyltransferase n=1 Tax=Frischella perrara TaxID=1267021 RepID=A0A0A7RYD8_FRIPE|nr:phosphoribosylglycinamide formyltransferase [Frischella perrara]AJA44325.1 phosphoribosylglycinamide formyltransferase, formyltetrahydrofolate-dependent [Frischella perrara]PWV64011.1 phosphoribosylglycinamide formyltransferase-1 [Frischella perrara]